MKNHYIATVTDELNPSDSPIQQEYFDGTQAQALKYFKSKKCGIARYHDTPRYKIVVQANPIVIKEATL
jgi:hypothetical protein